MEIVRDIILGAPESLQVVTAAMKLKDSSWKKTYDQSRQYIKNRDITLPTKVSLVKAKIFPVFTLDVRVGL